jgi:rare lipoprotein A
VSRSRSDSCAWLPRGHVSRLSLCAAVGLALSGCFFARRPPAPAPVPPVLPPAPVLPAPPAAREIPDAVPRYEPRSAYGNPPFYDVFGKRYFVLSSSADYVERGVASWYGPGFHKVRTSTGEIYDMYGMSAAHRTLPLPAYVRVTNLQNGRSVVVRVNDRGPFVGNRIIDLSYTAAAKLDMLRNGTAMVEVRSVGPASTPGNVAVSAAASDTPVAAAPPGVPPGAVPIAPAPVTSAPVTALYVQAGAFADPANAERLAARLRGGRYGAVFIRDDTIAGRKLYRVRIGPVPDVPEFDRIVAALGQAGVRDAHLALD